VFRKYQIGGLIVFLQLVIYVKYILVNFEQKNQNWQKTPRDALGVFLLLNNITKSKGSVK